MAASKLKRGELAELALRTGLSHVMIGGILRGQKRASAGSALALEIACQEIGIPLIRLDFLYPEESRSPLIHKPKKKG